MYKCDFLTALLICSIDLFFLHGHLMLQALPSEQLDPISKLETTRKWSALQPLIHHWFSIIFQTYFYFLFLTIMLVKRKMHTQFDGQYSPSLIYVWAPSPSAHVSACEYSVLN